MYWDRYDYYKPSRPRKAAGGIKLQSSQVKIVQKWWAKRWIDVLESFNIGARLSRGRAYARSGQVISLEINKGKVFAKVQGSRKKPYALQIMVKTLSQDEWEKTAAKIAEQPIFTAKLLAGEMPEDIESVFKNTGLSLLPSRQNDLDTLCTCPDWSNPCKHIAAVYYLLGEEFARDPFLIFKLRGLEREELVRLIGCKTNDKPLTEPAGAPPAQPLPNCPEIFWGRQTKCDLPGPVSIPAADAALAARLGKFPFWRGDENLQERLKEIYRSASIAGMSIFLGEKR